MGGLTVAPVDARDPRDRLIEIVSASEAGLVVTDTEHAATALAGAGGRRVLVLDDATVTRASTAPPVVEISADTPGYLFFTSGSTGSPKGVLGSHFDVVPRYVSFANEQGYARGDRVAVTATSSFSVGALLLLGCCAEWGDCMPVRPPGARPRAS